MLSRLANLFKKPPALPAIAGHEAEAQRPFAEESLPPDAVIAAEVEAEPWIGVGLDGTLAHCDSGHGSDEIGAPVFNMAQRVRDWHALGLCVKVFTWRAATDEGREQVRKWLATNDLPEIDITDAKDFDMVELWHCDAVQVIRDTGEAVGETLFPDTESK